VAEGDFLYDEHGNKIGRVGRQSAAGMFVVDTPALHPAAAPGVSEEAPSNAATTQQVQGAVETTVSQEIEGAADYIPFGPVITIEDGKEPDFPYTWTNDGPKRTFRLAASIGLMPLLRFANSAKSGMDSTDLEGMAALYSMIQDCVHPDDWDSFQAYSTMTKADDEDLMDFVGVAMEIITARPRKPRGSSSGTSPNTSARSKGGSSRQASVIPPGAITPQELDGLMPVADLVN
jgi:hypothetical protein